MTITTEDVIQDWSRDVEKDVKQLRIERDQLKEAVRTQRITLQNKLSRIERIDAKLTALAELKRRLLTE